MTKDLSEEQYMIEKEARKLKVIYFLLVDNEEETVISAREETYEEWKARQQ